MENYIARIQEWVWGWPTMVLILGVGLFLSIGLRLWPQRKLVLSCRLLWTAPGVKWRDKHLSPFSSLMTALSATIGTGNIAGVATAIAIGGPGAVFWMWMTALVGMATKYAEAVLAIRFREQEASGEYHGGPMYYIRLGLGKRWRWLAATFAVCGVVASFGIGNMVQANSLAQSLEVSFAIPPGWSALVLFVLVITVVIGGVQRIGAVASKMVPAMAILYLTLGVSVLWLNKAYIPQALEMIVMGGLGRLESVAGGVAGYGIVEAMRHGIARGVFPNEAGMGSAPIVHACSGNQNPVHQGLVATLGTLSDTIIMCTITALIILTSEMWLQRTPDGGALLTGSALTVESANASIGRWGGYIVSFCLVIFAFTTILGWGVYGEKCLVYLFGLVAVKPFRYLWAIITPVGALALLLDSSSSAGVERIWAMSDILNALMIFPNVVALILLSPVVFKLSREYFHRLRRPVSG